jgi:nucleoside-diphosphate kinase
MKLVRVTEQQAAEHYVEHVGKPFYPELVEFITSGPVVAMVIEGLGAVATVRAMMGATNPLDSAPGTIRGDYSLDLGRNVVHGSDSPGSAARETAIFFADSELQG